MKCWVWFPVLYSRSLLIIYLIYTSVLLLFLFNLPIISDSLWTHGGGQYARSPSPIYIYIHKCVYILQCSCLENPRDSRAWWAAVYGIAQSRTRLKQLSSSSSNVYIYIYIYIYMLLFKSLGILCHFIHLLKMYWLTQHQNNNLIQRRAKGLE